MKCYIHQLAFSAAISMAIFYTIGALIAYSFPQEALQLWAPLFYLKSTDLFSPFFGINVASVISGILQSFFYTYAYAWLLGTLYNKLMPQDI